MAAIYRLVKYAATSHEERDAAKTAPLTAGFFGYFPESFGMYVVGAGTDFQSQRFYLGSEAEGPLYALTFHDGPGFRQMELYSTTEYKAPLLALATNEKRYSSNGVITLPGNSQSETINNTERVKSKSLANVYTFGVNVGRGTEVRTELFEWREDKKPKPKIRRLVRIHDGGAEVVAIWREGSVPNRQGRLATFEFTGSGLTDELGDYWALMAVVTALRVCQSQW